MELRQSSRNVRIWLARLTMQRERSTSRGAQSAAKSGYIIPWFSSVRHPSVKGQLGRKLCPLSVRTIFGIQSSEFNLWNPVFGIFAHRNQWSSGDRLFQPMEILGSLIFLFQCFAWQWNREHFSSNVCSYTFDYVLLLPKYSFRYLNFRQDCLQFSYSSVCNFTLRTQSPLSKILV